MKAFEQCKTAKAVAAAITSAHRGVGKEQGSQTAFFRDSVKTEASTAILTEALRLLALTSEMRQSKYPEAGPFYMARTILANEARMTDPTTGEYHGHFKVSTKNCTKDKQKRLTSAPELEAKVRAVDAPEPEAMTPEAALEMLVKWAKGKSVQDLGALTENAADTIYRAIGQVYEDKAAAIIEAEAEAGNSDKADAAQKEAA